MVDRRTWGLAAGVTIVVVLGVVCGLEPTRTEPEAPEGAAVLADLLLPHCLYGLDPHANGVITRLQDGPGYGLRVGAFDRRAWMGFATGDTVLAVNGHPLGSADDWFRARQAVEGARLCDWTIRRDGEERHLFARRVPTPSAAGPLDRTEVLALLTDPYVKDPPRGRRHPGVDEVLWRAGAPPDARYVRGETPVDHHPLGLRAYLVASVLAEPGALVVLDPGEDRARETLQIVWTGAAPPSPITRVDALADGDDEYPIWLARAAESVALSRTDFDVLRSELRSWLADPGSLSQQGRVIPHRDAAGTVDGFRVSGIRRGSTLERLGLRNGDVVHAINGQAIVSMEAVSEATSQLQSSDRVVADITRRGAPLRLTYRFVDP